jgi:hypothetical protein
MPNPNGQPKQQWQVVARAYSCATCGAAPGHKCITTSGKLSNEVHSSRSQQASKNRWRNPDDAA